MVLDGFCTLRLRQSVKDISSPQAVSLVSLMSGIDVPTQVDPGTSYLGNNWAKGCTHRKYTPAVTKGCLMEVRGAQLLHSLGRLGAPQISHSATAKRPGRCTPAAKRGSARDRERVTLRCRGWDVEGSAQNTSTGACFWFNRKCGLEHQGPACSIT